MIVLIAKYIVKEPADREEVLEHLREMAPLVAEHEAGCAVYQASTSDDDDRLVLLHEHYRDAASLEAHRETEHFGRIIEGKVLPLLERREREVYTLAVG